MKTEKNENEPTASEVLQGFDFRLKTDSPPRIRHSRFTQKRIEEATKQINLVMKGFEGDSMMLQDTIDDLRKELEIQKNYAQDLSNWIKKADEIYWAKHKGTDRRFVHADLMTEAWLLIEEEKREQRRLELDSAQK